MKASDFCYSLFPSPLGPIGFIFFRGTPAYTFFCETEEARWVETLTRITTVTGWPPVQDKPENKNWRDRLDRYFSGEKIAFAMPASLQGTPLQKKIWGAIARIPYGTLQSYQSIADSLGMKRSARVVGGACASNPIPIIIPCHRVVRHDGALGGYRCGIPIKRKLLALEGVRVIKRERKR